MIRFEKVNKTYKNKKRRVHALKDVSLTFPNKGLFCIVGESGAGKSTFLNMLCLQDKPDTGDVFIMGKSTKKMNDSELSALRNDCLGIVFQDLNLIDSFNIYDNLTISYLLQNKTIDKNVVIDVLKKLNLDEEILNEDIYSLSGGQRQRIAIARALLKDSKVIVCDEPTGSLDEDNSFEIFKILKDISMEKLVIIVTHNRKMAKDFTSNIIEIEKGVVNNSADYNEELIDEVKIKHRIPSLKVILKLGVNSFRESISKSILTLVTVSIMLAVLLFGLTFVNYNERKAVSQAFVAENIDTVKVTKMINQGETQSIVSFEKNEMSIFENVDYIPVNDSSYISSCVKKQNINYFSYYTNKISYTLIGREPSSAQDTCEIAITKYVACYSLNLIDENDIDNNNKIKELLNKEFVLTQELLSGETNEYKFCVVGIIDTKYSKVIDNEYKKESLLANDYLNYELHSCIFLCEEEYNYYINEYANKFYPNFWTRNIFLINPQRDYFSKNEMESKMSSYSLGFHTRIDGQIVKLRSMMELYGFICLSIASFFIVVSLVFYLNYINYSFEMYIDKMKIFRSIGFSKMDTASVFAIQGIIVSLICMILSTMMYGFGGIGARFFMKTYMDVHIVPIYFDIISVIITFFALIIINILLASFKVLSRFKKFNV